MWDNCRAYNPPGQPILPWADNAEKGLLAHWRASDLATGPLPEKPTPKAKPQKDKPAAHLASTSGQGLSIFHLLVDLFAAEWSDSHILSDFALSFVHHLVDVTSLIRKYAYLLCYSHETTWY